MLQQITNLIHITKPTITGATGMYLLGVVPPSPDTISQWGHALIIAATVIAQVIHLFKKPKKQGNENVSIESGSQDQGQQ